MVLTLVGYMGAGKSTIGKKLAQELNVQFVDLDEFIEEKEQKPIPILFKEKGEIYFRKKENQYLKIFFQKYEKAILSTGGGTPVFYNNMELINQNSFSVYLRANPQQLAQRISPKIKERPLVAHLSEEDLPEFIAKHLFERSVFYEKAKLTIATDHQSPDEIVGEILQAFKNHQNQP